MRSLVINIFIGYEQEHPEAYEVCKESILRFNKDHEIQPLIKEELIQRGIYTRPYQGESTDFAFTRFLVPYLMEYSGFALFCDGDFLWRCDPQEIEEQINSHHGVYVVKHPELITGNHVKMEGKINRPYPMKYWSSLMYMDCDKCHSLTPDGVSWLPASDLHGFKWANGGIGELPATYNTLLGYYAFNDPKAVHFTDGGPWLEQYKNVEYADEWRDVYNWEVRSKEDGQPAYLSTA